MVKPIVYVARKIPDIAFNLLSEVAEVRLHSGGLPPTREELLEGVAGCQAILALLSDRIDEPVFDAAGADLKVISNFAVGFNNIDVPLATRRGVAVGNTPDVLTDATADIAVGLLLAAARCMRPAVRAVGSGTWRTWEPLGWIGLDIRNKTLGIVGMGRIGEAVARRMQGGWNTRILYTARSAKPDIDGDLQAEHTSLEKLLQESDFVSVHVPLTDETKHMIGAKQFAAMKSTAVLVNTARGEIIDQAALITALQNGQIFAAGLDVCTPEPLPIDNPLVELDNCFLLPHIGSATIDTRNAMAERAAQNIVAGLKGEKLPYPVNEIDNN